LEDFPRDFDFIALSQPSLFTIRSGVSGLEFGTDSFSLLCAYLSTTMSQSTPSSSCIMHGAYALRSLSRAFHFQKFIVNKVPLGAL